MFRLTLIIAFCCFNGSLLAQTAQSFIEVTDDVAGKFASVVADDRVQQALELIEAQEPEYIQEQLRITEIPAPPFQEEQRATYYLEQLRARGLMNSYIDEEGNVVAIREGTGNGPTLLIAAHLDTVFPPDIDTTVRFEDGRYYAPGIGDDTRGLAALLSVIDALNQSGIETTADIMFSGNVGEEGRGDLRGVKALFRDHPEIDGFISVDGVRQQRITTGGTGSRRFEFRFTGPGGHSFGAFGLPSAIHAMGRAIAKISELQTPQFPKTTFTVGTVTGGTSVNSIAADATFAIDMRSNDSGSLALLERDAKQAALAAVAEENSRWRSDLISVEFVLIGDRPVGRTPLSSPIVQVAALAFDHLDIAIQGPGISSTDSNVPMSMDIPAITIAGGGDGGGAHSPGEWFIPTDSHLGPQSVLLNILTLAGIAGVSEPALEERDS
ncbi:MAG: M20/M25/M40 family metallo-hydrolase [Pseudomonadales bacterium]|nr:M20/M25/M40 family metallo-hydrolase [Pseudomonadales bacterium]